jgi:Bacterial Ig domain/Polysaccharide deacetylase
MKALDFFSKGARSVMGSARPVPRRLMSQVALFAFNLLLVNALSTVTVMNSAEAASARTIVSLTFDDGLTQSPVRDILRSHGMKATIYVNANKIGSGGGYLSKAELDALFADGNEIAGHTTNHVDLATLSDAAQRTAICGDMQTLNTWYPGQIRSFAYPFASTGPSTQGIVAAGCTGVATYTSARTVGGLVSGNQCTGCATAETIPPGNPYFINTPESILSTTTLAQMQTLVTQAETTGGGWVPLVFHQVCSGTGCSVYSITPATLDAFLTWLKARESNFTYVRTVNQVMTGDLPAPPPPPPLGPNLLTNPSLELDVDGNNQADCWQRDAFGTNTGTWTRTSDAHAGLFAERLQLTAYSSGDRKLIPTLDAGQANGGCAPTVEAGATYQLGAWYKSTTAVIPVLFYRDAGGVWRYWRDGPLLPASANWAQMTYSPGALPAGAQAISFGITLDSVGSLTTDDYSMRKVLPASADTTPPTVALTAPAAGTVTGTITIAASAADNVGVAGVQFRVDGVNLGAQDTVAPYSIAWNTATAGNGVHTLSAVARDAAGNVTTSGLVSVTVSNPVADTTPPTVALSAPTAGATVAGSVSVTATAADNIGVAGVQFRLDGVNLGAEDTTSPYSITWNTATASNGAHALSAVARDAAGNVTTSTAVAVTVNNPTSQSLVANPSLEADANNDGIPDCWQLGGFGTNTFIWTRVAGAHSGSFAESLQVTARTSGDRKLLPTLDAGACAPAVTAGARYTLNAWYKSTVQTAFVVYYRNSAGTWTYWTTSPNVASAANWAQASFTTPALPAGATHLSFGLALSAVGTLVTDDYALVRAP